MVLRLDGNAVTVVVPVLGRFALLKVVMVAGFDG
jgi:hypothetical protein